MKTIITLLIIHLQVFSSFSQTLTTDELWTEDFEDNNYDLAIFTDANSRYNASIINGTFSSCGKVMKIVFPNTNTDGDFQMEFKFSYSGSTVYDSIYILPSIDAGRVLSTQQLSFTDNSNFNYPYPIIYTADLIFSYNYNLDNYKVCENCDQFNYDGFITGTFEYLKNGGVSTIYSSGPISNYQHNKSYDFTNTSTNQFYTMRSEFCTACASDLGNKSYSFNIFAQCDALAQIPTYSDINASANICFVKVVGYKNSVISSIEIPEINTNENSQVKYFDLLGRELATLNDGSTIYFAVYSDGTRVMKHKSDY